MTLNPEKAQVWSDRFAAPYLHPASGAVVAIVSARDISFRAYGVVDRGRPEPPSQETLFEIGSITKVFTAVLLAKLAADGRVDPHAPIGTIDRAFAGLPEWITPYALSTHTSGLPRVPVTFWKLLFMSIRNPYAEFSGGDLVAWMARYRPQRSPKQGAVHYSNLGVGLLGFVLGRVAGTTYAEALRAEILAPLGLGDIAMHLSEDQKARLAQPHTTRGKPTPPWDFDALAGCGALRATAADLLRFARAVIDAPKDIGPLHVPIAKSLEVQITRRMSGAPGQCLGWVAMPFQKGEARIFAHDGGTLGSSSVLLVSPDAGVAVVVLANRGMVGLWQQFRIIRSNPLQVLPEIAAA